MGVTSQFHLLLGPLLLALGAAFGLYGAAMFVLQPWIVFKPSRDMRGDPGEIGEAFEDVFLTTAAGVRIHGWWVAPAAAPTKLILYFPGSIGNLSHELSTIRYLVSFGAAVLAVDYPGFGRSQGRPSERGTYQTAEAAWNYAVISKGWRPADVVLFGRSLGVAVAARLAVRCHCQALVCHGGFTSVPDLAAKAYPLLPARYFCFFRFNTRKSIRRSRCPVLVLHSQGDTVIPFYHGEALFDAAPEPKRLIPMVGDHYGDEWQITAELRRLLPSLLKGEQPPWIR